MIAPDQTICPNCHLQYSSQNIPRLLTMCGHTFCQKCIKKLIDKKKVNGKFKITCPIDKKQMEISTVNPGLFPKNLSVLNIAKKRKQSFSHVNKLNSNISDVQSLMQQNMLQSHIHNILRQSTYSQAQVGEKIQKQAPLDICLLHLKPLDLICERECQKICSSCVIFGEHKNHKVLKTSEYEQNIKNVQQKLLAFLKAQKSCFSKLQSKEIQLRIQTSTHKKKSQLQNQINLKFKQLINQIQENQKNIIFKLDKKMEEIKNKIKSNLKQKIQVKDQYKDWRRDLQQKLKHIKGENQQQKLKVVLKSQKFIQLSEKYAQFFNQISHSFLSQSEKLLDDLTVTFDNEQKNSFLKQYCKLQQAGNSFLQMSINKLNLSNLNQQSLLQGIEQNPMSKSLIVKLSDRSQRSKNRQKKIVDKTPIKDKQLTTGKLSRVKSSAKVDLNRASSVLKASKSSLFEPNKLKNLSHSLKTKQIPQKYQAKIQAIIKGQSQVIDLTNAQLGNQKILILLQLIKDLPVTIVKIVKNRLTDQFMLKYTQIMKNVVMLNISKNQLTQKSIQYILQARKDGKINDLKSIMIGQNKFFQRNNKQKLDELKRLGINVCI